MIIDKFEGKVRIEGVVKSEIIYIERWLTSEHPNLNILTIKHEGKDWEVTEKDVWEVYELKNIIGGC